MAGCFDGQGKGEDALDLSKDVSGPGSQRGGDLRNALDGLFRARRYLMSSEQSLSEREDNLFATPSTNPGKMRGIRRVA